MSAAPGPSPAPPTAPALREAISAFPKFGDGASLPRILGFAAAEGLDLAALGARSIVVTGSKGKGGTAAAAAAGLDAAGIRTGLFTSPHLRRLNERIAIGGTEISDDAFLRALARVRRHAEGPGAGPGARMGAFEALFLAAALWFAEEAPDAMVWEAGIGGRLDPVRCLGARIGTLTSVELEHAAILGSRRDIIAYDKLDAIAPGGINVISPSVGEDLRLALAAHNALAGRETVFVADEIRAAAQVDAQGTTARFTGAAAGQVGGPLRFAMAAAHQVDNALTAARAAGALHGALRAGGDVGYGLLPGMCDLRWPGRMERICAAPEAWIDVGHTPESLARTVEALAGAVELSRALLVFGASEGKEIAGMCAAVAGRFGGGVILAAASKHGADPAALAQMFGAGEVRAQAADVAAACAEARGIAAAEGRPVAVLGGLFLAEEFRQAWAGGDPADLWFL
ncbi:glutamate ligase domain-containing protein [Rhodovulum sp. DZ06]|uniref:glutamate ligase domain-containing protein n=1 Tax=Rhodovulum sp. DZ06 TaxID=3425126 RepID=UPI003D331A47